DLVFEHGPQVVIALNRDGSQLAVVNGDDGGDPPDLRIIDTSTGNLLLEKALPLGGDGFLFQVAFSPNGSALALYRGLEGAGNAVVDVVFETLSDGSSTLHVRRQSLTATAVRAAACAAVGRNLTQVEWDRFEPGVIYRRTCSIWPRPD